ncbi:pilus assembly PilX family protein [Dechloromonas sp. A34]|uniref:pilus assembly PilX family protein n=1 Tax=Dechloromonas sp. A34 TaxID=447588 RepID=UPI002248E486|nr:PilX N-terminal domain-containing pilus assembly protein [Dechloromonas sp. A34]
MKMSLSAVHSQKGISLVVSLLILVMVTLLALSVVNTSIFEERMAGNTRDRSLAFESAEYAMREAQSFLSAAVLPPFTTTGGSTGGYYRDLNTSPTGQTEEVYWRDNHNWTANSVAATKVSGVLSGQTQPRYVIEEYPAISCVGYSKKWPPPPPRNVYKITARGQGGLPNRW